MTDLSEKKLVVLASGGGSNFQSLIDSLQNDGSNIRISALVVDRPCQATQRARQHGIDYFEVNRHNDSHYNTQVLKTICQSADLIVCAGYLSILSAAFIAQFPEKIINIHPSLLPKFGAKIWRDRHVRYESSSSSHCRRRKNIGLYRSLR